MRVRSPRPKGDATNAVTSPFRATCASRTAEQVRLAEDRRLSVNTGATWHLLKLGPGSRWPRRTGREPACAPRCGKPSTDKAASRYARKFDRGRRNRASARGTASERPVSSKFQNAFRSADACGTVCARKRLIRGCSASAKSQASEPNVMTIPQRSCLKSADCPSSHLASRMHGSSSGPRRAPE
jgi:hypothetical protein